MAASLAWLVAIAEEHMLELKAALEPSPLVEQMPKAEERIKVLVIIEQAYCLRALQILLRVDLLFLEVALEDDLLQPRGVIDPTCKDRKDNAHGCSQSHVCT